MKCFQAVLTLEDGCAAGMELGQEEYLNLEALHDALEGCRTQKRIHCA